MPGFIDTMAAVTAGGGLGPMFRSLQKTRDKKLKDEERAKERAERDVKEGTEKAADLPEYRKGGRVKKTGPAKLHKGEMVVRKSPRKRARRGR